MPKQQRIILGLLAFIGVLIVAVAVAGYYFLQSASFERLAIRTIVKDTNEVTGGRVEIASLDFQLATLTAHLYNITIHGSEPPPQPPLLHVDKLTVGFKIQSILRRKFTLSELLIEHPVVNVRVTSQGQSNLPQSAQPATSGHSSVFDLAVGRVLLTNGEIKYNDKAIPLDADLYGLRTEVSFNPLATRYLGTISYDSGHLHYAGYSPFGHSLNAKFNATPTRFALESAQLSVGSSILSVHAEITDYANPAVAGSYHIRLHTQDFAALLQPITPAGEVSLSGEIHYAHSQQSLLRNLSVIGQVASDNLIARAPQGRVDVRKLEGSYQLRAGRLQANNIVFETMGGRIVSNADIQQLDTKPVARVHAALQEISLLSVQHDIPGAKLQGVNLRSTVDGTAEVSWAGSVSNLRARADLTLKSSGQGAGDRALNPNIIPMDGAIHASYDGPRNVIFVSQTDVRIPSATLTAQGEISDHSNLQIQANSNDLHQLAELLSALGDSHSASIEISGSASAKALVQGSLQRPLLAAQANAQNLEVQGSKWSSATFNLQASPTRLLVQNATLVNAHQGKASLSGSVTLRNWSYAPASPLNIRLSAERLSLTDLQRLANQRYPISGDLSAEVSLSGSQLNPAGSGTAKIDNARVYGEVVQRLAATFHADKNSIHSNMEISLPAGAVNGTISYTPATQSYSVRLNAPSVALQKLQAVKEKNFGVAGNLRISASGQGTLDNPQLTATVEVPQLQLRDKSISQMKADLKVATHKAEFALDSNVAQVSVHAHGSVELTGDYYAEAAIDTGKVALDPLLAMYAPQLPKDFQGETQLHATLKGPLKNKSRLEAHLTIPTLRASYQSLEIGAVSPIQADYANSVATLQPVEIRGTDTSLRLRGSVPFDEGATPSLTAEGSVDVRILRIFDPDLQSSGTLALNVHASGTAQNPVVQGQVHLQDVALSTPAAPLGVQNLNGTLDIANKAVNISRLAGEVGGGEMSIGGSISYQPLQFNLTLQSKSVRLLYPDGLRNVLDANLIFSGTKDASTLSGRVLLDSLSFTPDFDLTKFSDQFGSSTVPAEPGLADNVKLAINVQSKGALSANSSQLSVTGQANVRVTGTAANPVVIGRTDLTSGELFYRNIRYQLQRGLITFDDPSQTNPVLDVSATTTVEQYNLTLRLKGPFDKLNTSYTSDPPLATADIINLIANGQTTQEAAASSQSTDSMIASQVAGQVAGSVQHLAGISSLQIDPLLGGNNQNASARVAIQQRVTRNFLFSFSTDLSQPGTEVVQGDYQLNKRWSVSVTRDETGGVSVDGKYHTKF
jgi:translocation and assembly module TamB